MRFIVGLSTVTVLFAAASASAQYPGSYGGYGGGNGGLYGGGVSPYLNLRRGGAGNSAANYYNFVRPYTGGTFGNAFVGPSPAAQMGRPSLFPNLRPIYDDDPASQTLERDKDGIMRTEMPPAGHGAGFMNTMGFFGPTSGMQGQGAARLGTPTRRQR